MAIPSFPTVLAIFGATGDLFKKKIIPALYHLYKAGYLPEKIKIIGVGRREMNLAGFYSHILAILAPHITAEDSVEDISSFIQLFDYHQGYFDDPGSYQRLKTLMDSTDYSWGMCTNKLFYLAIPPDLYYPVLENLSSSELTKGCSPEEGWTRVIVEKPLGKNAVTAEKLDHFLGSLFKEEQIYRIDHYLAKEMVQNILSFRFSNNLFEQSWNRDSIESINIRLWEKVGVEDRGNFYDGVGALRDVGQNHLLQMLAFVTMDHPLIFEPQAIRTGRARALKNLHILDPLEIKQMTYRAQYNGYHEINGVDPDSQTETFFRIETYLESPKWQNVPVFMEGGKRIGEVRKELEVTFRHPSPCLCPPNSPHLNNSILFSLEPNEGISIHFWSKKPGFEYKIEQRKFDFFLRPSGNKKQYVEEYEKLLLDCILGDQTLFLSTEEVKEMWNFIDPIVEAWSRNEVLLDSYTPGATNIGKL